MVKRSSIKKAIGHRISKVKEKVKEKAGDLDIKLYRKAKGWSKWK